MNKKIALFAAFAAVAAAGTLTSCSQDDEVSGVSQTINDNAIKFNIAQNGALGTRGISTASGNWQDRITDFSVYAVFASGATGAGVNVGDFYVGTAAAGQLVTGRNGIYSYPENQFKYWPAKTAPLNFSAITPASDPSFSVYSASAAGSLHLGAIVTVPTNVENQKDIMIANTNGLTVDDRIVSLTFKHALSNILFQAKSVSDNMTITVEGVELCNAKQVGFVENRWPGEPKYLWGNLPSIQDVRAKYSAGLKSAQSDRTVVGLNGGNAVRLTSESGELMLVPQTTDAWVPNTGGVSTPISAADANKQSYLKVTCTVMNNGVTLVTPDKPVYIPFKCDWEQGKRYIYNIVFGDSQNTGYDENGDPLDTMVPITYEVAGVEDWVAGTADEGDDVQ